MRFIHIVLVSLQLVGSFAGAADSEPPVWVVDPSKPGPDLPPTGASLFDAATLDANGARNVPFPFEKLLQRLEAAAGCSATARCERSVLLPLGRSLQRVAASPDFFASPRIVTAMVAEGRGPLLLRDRLFIGYQERSALIEVISYNEAAGRFEFQLVKNYREGARPAVFHARREVCLACHQNHAPIFPRQVWDETNANPAIAARLEQHRKTYHSIAARGSTDIANAIDDATDRANRLSLVNLLWREGCGATGVGERCRAAVLTAALQFALTGQRAYDDDQLLRNEAAATFHRNAQRLWPGGLAVANPDVPNRDPLAQDVAGPSMAHVPADFEALAPRAPILVLPADGAKLADVLVKGVAESLAPGDVQALGAALGARKPAARRTLEGRCELQRTEARIRFDCAHRVPDQAFELRGWINSSSGAIDSLRIGDQSAIRHLEVGSIRRRGAAATFVPRMHAANARLPDGDAVERISLAPLTEAEGRLTIVVAEDFDAVRPVIASTLEGRAAFRRADLRQIVDRIDGRDSGDCCLESVSASAAVEPAPESPDATALIAPFKSQCGACHYTAEATPPNFLSGDAARVRRALQSCAPRIFVRLAMNELPATERDKTPMPPESPSVSEHMSAGAPLRGDLLTMRAEVERLLRAEYGRAPSARELLINGYEALRPCLLSDPLTPALSPRERGDFQP
jgi:hypothetical protein